MSITLVFDDLLLQDVKGMFAHDDILEIENSLAAIIVHSPKILSRLQDAQLLSITNLLGDI